MSTVIHVKTTFASNSALFLFCQRGHSGLTLVTLRLPRPLLTSAVMPRSHTKWWEQPLRNFENGYVHPFVPPSTVSHRLLELVPTGRSRCFDRLLTSNVESC